MLVIRLRRIGRKHDPHYRLVVTEHTAPIQGKFIAEVGHYHPKSKELVIERDLFLSWLNKGAKPSNTVAKLATRLKIDDSHIVVKTYSGKPKKKAQAASNTEPKAKTTDKLTEENVELTEVKPEQSDEPDDKDVATDDSEAKEESEAEPTDSES